MSVYNGERAIEKTVKSILTQTLIEFEFIIVNDGSTDRSEVVLNELAKADSRIRVIHQANEGLTNALNIGCRESVSSLIARQDVGDVSLPDRLEVQATLLESDSRIVAAGCGARRIGPRGEFLGQTSRQLSPQAVTAELVKNGTGLLHPASIFRKAAFDRAGGYRPQFRFAQDTDLWFRLSEVGLLAECPEVLFDLAIETAGISAQRIDQQVKLWHLARECYAARKSGISEIALLEKAQQISNSSPVRLSASAKFRQQCRAEYFVGSQLLALGNRGCRSYFLSAMRTPSLLLQASGKLLRSYLSCK